ncbi:MULTISPECIES: NUDIX domain-containing protein [Salinicola]|uniref:ADP-ribose pyrophosphatase n=1 Tax=Salinicola socius TaxID=404433 RepID=A0A1Q8SSQ3_9GAMM|nr:MULTISPECIES: NUDIX domain-containing protein [Salinicola]OLO04454.1 ADP-ribose diphosphatase [Salinicola socius]
MDRKIAPVNRFDAKDVDRIEDQQLYSGFFDLEKRRLRHRQFNGEWSEPVDREVHVRRNAVGVLLYDPSLDRVALVEQIRAGALEDPISPWKLEPVAGLVEPGETPADVARREALEEAGCEIGELIELHRYYPSPGACTEQVTLFCGLIDSTGLGGIHGVEDENEDILVHVMSYPEAWDRLMAGQLDNAMALIGFHWLARERATLRARA